MEEFIKALASTRIGHIIDLIGTLSHVFLSVYRVSPTIIITNIRGAIRVRAFSDSNCVTIVISNASLKQDGTIATDESSYVSVEPC